MICIIGLIYKEDIRDLEQNEIIQEEISKINEDDIILTEESSKNNIINEEQKNEVEDLYENEKAKVNIEKEDNNEISKKSTKDEVNNKKPIIESKVDDEIKQEKSEEKQEPLKDKENDESIKVEEKEEKQDEEKNEQKKIDLSKYDYYEKGIDGTYKGFIYDEAEITKLKLLIDEAINSFGYKNMKIIVDSSLAKDGTRYFTANKTNVENLVYDSEGFNIYYYAVKEYFISADGVEKYFQTRSYIKVK